MMQSGSLYLDSNMDGWTLHTGNGERMFVSPDIPFRQAFPAPPNVVVSLAGIDGTATTNLRARLELTDVERDEFNVVVHTWDDTLLFGVGISWIAYDG